MNILIVDDEPIFREWFQMTVAKLGGSYHIAGESANGLEALQFCRDHAVDLVVTDVKMPGMNGIELIQNLKQELPRIRSVIFSSYNEFQFAAEALKFGASEYILKAEITLQGLSEVLGKIETDMELDHSKLVEINSLRNLLNQNQLALRTVYLRELLLGGQQEITDFHKKMELFDIVLTEKNMTILALGVLPSSEPKIKEEDLRQLAVTNIVNETLLNEAGNGCSFQYEDHVYMLMVNIRSSSMKSQRESLLLVASRVMENLRKYIGVQCAIGISTTYSQLTFMPEQAREALEALQLPLFYEDRSIVYAQSTGGAASTELIPVPDTFHRFLESGQLGQASAACREFLDTMAKHHTLSAKQARAVVLELTYAMVNKARSYQVPASKLDLLYSEAHMEVVQLTTFLQLRDWTLRMVDMIVNWIESYRRKYGEAVQGACDFIQSRFTEELTLQQVAEQVHLSRNYFSELFKKETGTNFNEYLMQVRLEHAMQLLRTRPLKVSEVAERVGYANASYFIKLFRKYTGSSPHDYMESYQGSKHR
ncbi:helix-turn-helix domain-containing protein [Paenibacillus sp. Soil750]|uniref:helix-turn-helix domain-containing protein n=1 Tax=Paenibacillus sp. Soil750 TaxID=1736398 RepID=UPI0006F47E75|nr:helix-turn-helix domain-containing protein [Paenibacillus sp. Soil750]KRE58319.1 AraC family transcriptional regulator [Paenibacillus sp. Soil750]